MLFTDELSVREHIAKLIELMSQGLYEKEHIMAVALLSAISGESIFLLGPPGTAKSMVSRRLKLIFREFQLISPLYSFPTVNYRIIFRDSCSRKRIQVVYA